MKEGSRDVDKRPRAEHAKQRRKKKEEEEEETTNQPTDQPRRKQRSRRGLCKQRMHVRKGSTKRRHGNEVVCGERKRCVRRADARVDALWIQTRGFHVGAPSFAAGVTTTEDADTVTGLER